MSLFKYSILLVGLLPGLASDSLADSYTFAVIRDPMGPGLSFFTGLNNAVETVAGSRESARTGAFGIDNAGQILGILENLRANSGLAYSGSAFEPFNTARGGVTFGYRLNDAAEIAGNYFDPIVNGELQDTDGNPSDAEDGQ